MKINTSLALRNPLTIEENIDVTNFDYSSNFSLKAIKKLKAKATITMRGELFSVLISLSGVLSLECAYSLEIFDQKLSLEEELFFSSDFVSEEDEEVFYEKGPIIELDPYIFGLILAHIPLRVVKPGAKLPKNIDNVEITGEEEFYEARKNVNNPFNDLNLDDFED